MAQIEELKTLPADGQTNAVEMAAKALDKELNATGSSGTPAPVNDLTSIVKKKKKPVPEEGNAAGKRKAESEVEDASAEKKVRLEDGAPAS
jgi:HAT1-interacting factor 1